jgi:hypothetical protein
MLFAAGLRLLLCGFAVAVYFLTPGPTPDGE